MPLYEFAGFRLDADKRLLMQRDGAAVGITPKGYETLAYLVKPSGAVVEKERMIRAIWPDTAVEENNLTQNISLLRRVLAEGRGEHRFIVTVPGRGYQFVAPVSVVSQPDGGLGSVEDVSIAVLPFINNSTDPEYDYFAESAGLCGSEKPISVPFGAMTYATSSPHGIRLGAVIGVAPSAIALAKEAGTSRVRKAISIPASRPSAGRTYRFCINISPSE
jgi:DNA-binding winged helix-turn-helix (wHTH) protein